MKTTRREKEKGGIKTPSGAEKLAHLQTCQTYSRVQSGRRWLPERRSINAHISCVCFVSNSVVCARAMRQTFTLRANILLGVKTTYEVNGHRLCFRSGLVHFGAVVSTVKATSLWSTVQVNARTQLIFAAESLDDMINQKHGALPSALTSDGVACAQWYWLSRPGWWGRCRLTHCQGGLSH